ncbi:MAG: class D beta-lactamase [Balneolaceae bacterium]|nr:class D beta-lactamase [Balneolaceae bacterium]
MKSICTLLALAFFFSCSDRDEGKETTPTIESKSELPAPNFQAILDSADVLGSILIYDLNNRTYHSNDFKWAKTGQLPASTFKIPNSIIALETGVVENDSILFEWDDENRALSNWEQDLYFSEAFQYSCVPCYQEVAREIGLQRMKEFLDTLDYGNMQVDSTNLDMFWLQGESRISQFEQIDFLQRLYQSELPISKRSEIIIKRMMVIEENQAYTLSGKTGWSISNGEDNGWFVGYIETQLNTYFFATNIEPTPQFEMGRFPQIRREVTLKAFKQMSVLQ